MSAPAETKILGMSLGAEPKKVAALGVLVVLGLVGWWANRDTTVGAPLPPASPVRTPPKLKSLASDPADPATGQQQRKRLGSRQAVTGLREFKVSLKPDKDNPIDPTKVDPTLRLALLARAQNAALAGGNRSLFDFGGGAALTAETKPGSVIIKPKKPDFVKYGPEKPPPIPGPPPPPPPPPIPLKFYGFVNASKGGDKRAFFMENEDIYIAREGELIKNRYKLVKIGVNTAVLEDTQFKNQQTVKLQDEAQSAN